MRVFLRAPAADRMIIDPEGFSPGAGTRMASARRQRVPAPLPMLLVGHRLDNSMAHALAHSLAHNDEASVWARGRSSLSGETSVPRRLWDERKGLIEPLHLS